jgi:hypothetical protein
VGVVDVSKRLVDCLTLVPLDIQVQLSQPFTKCPTAVLSIAAAHENIRFQGTDNG